MADEQLSNAVSFACFFQASADGTGVAALADVTVDVRNPAGTLIVTGGAASEIGGGLYGYALGAGSVLTVGTYQAVFKTGSALVAQKHLASQWIVGTAGVENLDAAISTLPTDQDVRDAMKLAPTALPAPAAGSVDEHLDTLVGFGAPPAMISGQQIRDAMKLDAGVGAPAAGSVDTHLDDILLKTAPAAIAVAVLDVAMAGHVIPGSVGEAIDLAANCCAGPGAIEFIYTVTSSVAPNPPVPSASVWVSTDPAGANVIASGFTDMLGNVTFWLDPGTYYFWRAHSGFTGVNPDLETVV